MCGICGKLHFEAPLDAALICQMRDSMVHRGPDDGGIYSNSNVALGHRRLSIIDLNGGHQPLSNEDGSVWIVFNGEIYNFKELQAELAGRGHTLKTNTDTEVIVHLFEECGPACLEKLRGMFALAIWDAKRKVLFLARDRVGIKPLYYSVNDRSFSFASEIKALLVDPDVRRDLAPEMIDRFLMFSYLPGNETLFRSIRKLAPGHYMIVKDGRCEVVRYWDLRFENDDSLYQNEAESRLLDLMKDSVNAHMIADVPVGVLLSGGLDSTAVLSFAVENTDKKINTFTVGFSEPSLADERPYAKIAADYFGTQHYDITITASEFVSCMPRYVWHMEEPVCEPPAIALYYVSKLAKNHVKVLLSGEGGDEAFAGYCNYRNLVWLERIKAVLSRFRGSSAYALFAVSRLLRSSRLAKYSRLMEVGFPDYYCSRTFTAFGGAQTSLPQFYTPDFARLVNRDLSVDPLRRLQTRVRNSDVLNAMLYIDTKSWLPDDLLIKADKMTMANSLELRVPLLDHRILEFAARVPSRMKIRGHKTKYFAKRALESRVPRPILARKKAGFPVPYDFWLRRTMRDWVHDVLCDSRTKSRGYFKPVVIRQLLARNESEPGFSKLIFSLVTLELWHRIFVDREPLAGV